MADYTSIQIIKKAQNVWVFSDNTLPSEKYWISNAYQDVINEDLVSFTTRNGSNIYNSQPYSIYSYTDELDSEEDFTPTSALDLHTKLQERGFFGTSGGGGSTPTLQGLANSLFGSLFGRGGQVVLIDDSELGFTTAIIDNLFQNNKPRYFRYFYEDDGNPVYSSTISATVNALTIGYTIAETDTPVIVLAVKGGKTYVFLYNKGKGIYGGVSGQTTSNDFRLLSVLITTPEDIENDPNATIIPLDGVVDNDFLAVANLTEWDFSDSGDETEDGGTISYYFSFTGTGGVEFFVRFIGEPGIYGGTEPDFTADMFTEVTNSEVLPEVIPTLQEVTESGATTNLPIVITDESETESLTHNSDGIAYDAGGFTTEVKFAAPSANRSQTIQDKDGTIALLSDLENTPAIANGTFKLAMKGSQSGVANTDLNVIEINDWCLKLGTDGEGGFWQYTGGGDTDPANYIAIITATGNS